MLVVRASPILAFVRPDKGSEFRKHCFDLVMHKYFEIFIMVCIFFNTIILASSYFGEPEKFTYICETIN